MDSDKKYNVFGGKISFDDPSVMRDYINNCDGPEITQFLTIILDQSTKNGSFDLGEAVIVSDVLKRTQSLLSLIKRENKDD